MKHILIDVKGKKCPEPMVEFMRHARKARKGSELEIIGTHKPSKDEILMAAREMDMEIIEVSNGDVWRNVVKK